MSHPHIETPQALYAAYSQASAQLYYPRGTVRCSGDPMFRTRAARDLGCILDVDPRVINWLCLPVEFETELGLHVPDFLVDYEGGLRIFLDAVEDDDTEACLAMRSKAASGSQTPATCSATPTAELPLTTESECCQLLKRRGP